MPDQVCLEKAQVPDLINIIYIHHILINSLVDTVN
jgi:hypothetical protein